MRLKDLSGLIVGQTEYDVEESIWCYCWNRQSIRDTRVTNHEVSISTLEKWQRSVVKNTGKNGEKNVSLRPRSFGVCVDITV